MKLIRQRDSLGPELDYTAGERMLGAVRASREPVLRLYQPRPTVAFGRRDELLAGFGAAERSARRARESSTSRF